MRIYSLVVWSALVSEGLLERAAVDVFDTQIRVAYDARRDEVVSELVSMAIAASTAISQKRTADHLNLGES